MENKIVTAIFKDSTHTKVSDVWQWDYGQILRIQGLDLPTAVEVDFAVAGASESIARIGTTKDGVTDVVIPDSLIETGKNLVAYIYLRDSASGNTEYQIDMLVTKRAKPEAYDRPEDKKLFGQAIEAVNTAADRAEKAGQTAQEAAQKAGLDAEQTAQDRAEVAKMVETVSDISEQVKKVEQLSQQVQEAATKTGQDAQQTAEDRVEVGKMLETVRDVSEQVKSVEESVRKAKESEQAAAGHRTAVEEMKNSVEQTASTFPQKVQEGVQAIENAGASEVQEITQAGTAQKTAVEAAGTQAVESVENVQQVATEAVETAKTEAVQAVQAEGAKQIKEVQDKGAEVLQSIPEDFTTQMETKLNKQQGIENKGKVLVIGEDGNVVPGEVSSGGGDGIAIINTMSGESPLVIPDSAERPLERLELGGKTEQVQTSGKNLFDFSNLESGRINISTGALEEHNHTRRLADYIDITDITSYSIYLPGYNKANGAVYVIIYYYDKDKNYLSYKPCGDKIEKYENITPVENAVYIKVSLEQNTIDNPQNIFKVQLEKGAKSTAYEPYTGGKPSPSPEYPQEIKSVGKLNADTQKYEVSVKLTGKNLFDREKAKNNSSWIIKDNDGYAKFPIYVKQGNKITFSYTEKLTTGKKFYLGISLSDAGSTVAWLYHDTTASLINNKYTIAATNDYIYLMCSKSDIQNFVDTIQTLQVEISPTQTDYVPYAEQSLTLTSDRPITKWDRLVEQGGQIGWLYGTEKYVVTGQEEFITNKSYALEESVDFSFINSNQAGIRNATDNFCNKLTFVDAVWSKNDIGFGISGSEVHIRLSLDTIGATKTDESEIIKNKFTEYLSKKYSDGEPFEFWHKSKTQEFVPLPQSEQNAIRALKTYYPTTVITVDGGELDPDIKVTYTADTKNYIDNKVSAKVASIIRQYRLNTANLLSLMPMETQATMIENDTNNILNNLESEEAHE